MNASRPVHEAALPDEPSHARTQFPPSVADHEMVRCIGRGSYGEVWLGRNVLGEYRAVKVVYRRSFDHDRPFEREFAGIQKFEPISRSHPSQLSILHVGRNDSDGYFYYVMELADDMNAECKAQSAESANRESTPHTSLSTAHSYVPRTLKLNLQRRGRLPFDDCVQIGLALTTALTHLHKHGLVHRDVKPSNIIFVNGRAKLADIGLVTSVDATRSFVGTEGYLAPEGPGTPQADIFSLGKVLYEMSTGEDRRHFPALPPEITQLTDQQQLSELNSVVVKACQHDPRLRYPSAEAMQADLARLQAGRSVRRKRKMERRWAMLKKFGPVVPVLALLIASPWFMRVFKHRGVPTTEAVRLYKLGLWYQQQLTDESLKKAIDYLNEAIRVDPGYPEPYAALVGIYTWSVPGVSEEEKQQRIKQIAEKLLHLAPNLAEGHCALSYSKYYAGDWRGTEEEIQRALRLNPNYAQAHGFYCYYLSVLGRVGDAEEHGRRAQELDPTSRIFATIAGYPFITARQYEKGIAQFRKALELDSTFPFAHEWTGKALEAKGQYLAALGEFERAAILSGADETKIRQGFDQIRGAYTNSGPRGYWLKVLEFQLAAAASHKEPKLAEVDRWPLGGVYARLGETNKALEVLEKDSEANGGDDWLKLDPIYEPLRDEPRFKALLRKAGLEN